MIGRFWYAEIPRDDHIAIRLVWRDGLALAKVEPPTGIADTLGDIGVMVRREDEFLDLPIAIGYAVLIAGLADTSLTFTGDVTVWPPKWGILLERPRSSVASLSD